MAVDIQQWCRFRSTDSFTLSCALGHRARIRRHMKSRGGNRNCLFGALTGHRVQLDSQWSAFCKHIHIVPEPLSKHAKEQEAFPS